jgi:hypothetical protein
VKDSRNKFNKISHSLLKQIKFMKFHLVSLEDVSPITTLAIEMGLKMTRHTDTSFSSLFPRNDWL